MALMNVPPTGSTGSAHVPPAATDDDYRTFPTGLQRAGAASGLIFFLLIVISIFFDPSDWPDFADSAEEYRQFATDNRDDMQVGQIFGALGLLAFVWFVAFLRGTFARAENWLRGYTRLSDAVFAGGLLAAALIAGASMMTVAAVSEPEDTDGAIIRAVLHASDALWVAAILGFIVMLTAAGMFILRTRVLPVWLGPVALVSALAWLVLIMIGIPSAEDPDDSALGFLWPIAFLLFMIWIVATSILLIRRVGKPWPWPGLERAGVTTEAPPPPPPTAR